MVGEGLNGERERTVREVRALATELISRDRALAELLGLLGDALERNQPEDVRAYVSAIPPRSVAEGLVQKHRSVWGVLELVRGGLVLLPIAVTWYGLSAAAGEYGDLLARRPELISQPFLLLWQGGFEGAGGLSFSGLAAIDGALISLLIGLSLAIHYKADVRDPRAEVRQLLRESQVRGLFARALALSPATSAIAAMPLEGERGSFDVGEAALALRVSAERLAEVVGAVDAANQTAAAIQRSFAEQAQRATAQDGALVAAIDALRRDLGVTLRGPSALTAEVGSVAAEQQASILEQTRHMVESLDEARKSQQVALGSVTLQTDAMNYMAKALVLASERVQVAAQALGDAAVPGDMFRRRGWLQRWWPAIGVALFAMVLSGGLLLANRAAAENRALFLGDTQIQSQRLRGLDSLTLALDGTRSSASDAALASSAAELLGGAVEVAQWLERQPQDLANQPIAGALRAVTEAAFRGARGVSLWLQASPPASERVPAQVTSDVLFAASLLRDLHVQIAIQAAR